MYPKIALDSNINNYEILVVENETNYLIQVQEIPGMRFFKVEIDKKLYEAISFQNPDFQIVGNNLVLNSGPVQINLVQSSQLITKFGIEKGTSILNERISKLEEEINGLKKLKIEFEKFKSANNRPWYQGQNIINLGKLDIDSEGNIWLNFNEPIKINVLRYKINTIDSGYNKIEIEYKKEKETDAIFKLRLDLTGTEIKFKTIQVQSLTFRSIIEPGYFNKLTGYTGYGEKINPSSELFYLTYLDLEN